MPNIILELSAAVDAAKQIGGNTRAVDDLAHFLNDREFLVINSKGDWRIVCSADTIIFDRNRIVVG